MKPFGSVTVAVLTIVPVTPGLIVPVAVIRTLPPGGRRTGLLRSPLPAMPKRQVAPGVRPVQVHDTSSSSPGKTSPTTASRTALGPWLVTTMS